MNCRSVRRRLPAAAGGDLAPATARRLQAHLERCPDCRREHDRLAAAVSALRRAGGAQPPALSPDRIWRGVRGRLAPGARSPAPALVRLWRRPVPVPVAIAAVLVAGVGVSLGLVLWRHGVATRVPALVEAAPPAAAEARLAARSPAYRPVPPPRFALENAQQPEVGPPHHDLPWVFPRSPAGGEVFVLEHVAWQPGERQRMAF